MALTVQQKEFKVLLLSEGSGAQPSGQHTVQLANQLALNQALAGVVGPKNSWLNANSKSCKHFLTCGFDSEIDMPSVFTIYKYIKDTKANILHCTSNRDLVATALARLLPGVHQTVLIKTEYLPSQESMTHLSLWAYAQCLGIIYPSQLVSESLSKQFPIKHKLKCFSTIIPKDEAVRAERYFSFYQKLLTT